MSENRQVSTEQAVYRWLADKPDERVLYLDGPTLSGKSALLTSVARSLDGNVVYVDASGMNAAQLVRTLTANLEFTGPPRLYYTASNIPYALAGPRTVIVLSNVQWATHTRTGAEAEHIDRNVVIPFNFGGMKANYRLLVEVDSSRVPLHSRAAVVYLPASGASASVNQELASLSEDARQALRVLALAESKRVSLEEWNALISLVGPIPGEQALRELAESSPYLRFETGDGEGVAYAREGVAEVVRSTAPTDLREAFHRANTVQAQRRSPSVPVSYSRRAGGAHAAALGTLDSVLEDPAALAFLEPQQLLECLTVAYPDGILPATPAADLHYLDDQGIAPETQAEWVSWLHHTALSWKDTARAESLTEAFTDPLPWQTLWSHWKPGGWLRSPAPRTGRIGELRLSDRDGYIVSTHHDGETIWEAATGRLVTPDDEAYRAAPPTQPAAWQIEQHWNFTELITVRPTNGDGEGGTLRLPGVETAVASGDLIILGGDNGLFAVRPEASLLTTHDLPFVQYADGPHGTIVPRPFDPEECRPTRERLTATFGPTAVHRLPEDRIPAGITEPATRRFLHETGFPAVSLFYTLDTITLSQQTPEEIHWHPTLPSAASAPTGPLYNLGEWIGGTLCLDGTTGHLFHMPDPHGPGNNETEPPFAATSLETFTAMLCLHWRHMQAYTQSGGLDGSHNLDELQAWLAHIDPHAAASRPWQHVLDPDNFYIL